MEENIMEILINTFEELKKYIFVIDRKDKGRICVRFKNEHFYHLVGLHKINNFDRYFPTHIKSKDKRYKYMKKNITKFNNILKNQLKEKGLLSLRITTFYKITDILKGNNTSLYNLKQQNTYSLYDGDFGLMKMYEKDICCLLGLKIKEINEYSYNCNCTPNSWMASKRINKLVEFKKPTYIDKITAIPLNITETIMI